MLFSALFFTVMAAIWGGLSLITHRAPEIFMFSITAISAVACWLTFALAA